MQSSTNIDRTVSFLRASLRNYKKFISDLFSYHLNKISYFNVNVDYESIFVWIPFKYKYKPKFFKDKYLNIKDNVKKYTNFAMEIKESMLIDIKMLYNKGV